VSLGDLRQAAARITRLYRDQGYFLARAYVPAQEISGGVVRIAVIEGRYDTVAAAGSARLDDDRVRQLLEAQGVTAGQPVERARLERSLILLEQWTGTPAQALLRPGATLGTSHMDIAVPSGPLIGGSLGADNYGAYYSGQGRVTASLAVNSPFGIGDRGSVWLAHSSGADAVFATYQAPVGYDGLTLGASASYYRYALCCEFAALDRTGDASVAGVQARYPLRLRQDEIMVAGLSLEYKRLSDSWAGGELDDKRAEVVSLSLDGIAAALAGQTRYRLALTAGDLDIKGPADYIALNAATVDTAGRYAKAWGEVEFMQPLASWNFLTVRLSGQVASRNLDSSEKFLLGGFNGIRAYPEGEAAGDEAWLARVDWVIPLGLAELSGRAAVRAFVDNGAIWINDSTRGGLADPGVSNHYSLSGAGLGFSWTWPQGWAFSAYVASKLGNNPGRSASGNDADGKDSRVRGWISAEWGF
jgi:hemolysin activation/secretion protein